MGGALHCHGRAFLGYAAPGLGRLAGQRCLAGAVGIGFGWAVFYFTALVGWTNGQTIGKKLCQIRIVRLDGVPLDLWQAFSRQGGYGAGFATGLLGFLQIFWDPNRQAIQDKGSGTVVIRLNKPKQPLHH